MQGVVCFGGPDEGFGIFVMRGDVLLDHVDELGYAAEHAPAQAPGGDVAKEAFHPVQPRRRSRCEMNLAAGVMFQPFVDLGMLRTFSHGAV